MLELITVKCSKCGTELRIHDAIILTTPTPFAYQMTIVPTSNTADRTCPGCSSVISPILINPQIAWVAMDQPKIEEPKRIIPAGSPLPVDFQKRIKIG